jgi:hypothetical protein
MATEEEFRKLELFCNVEICDRGDELERVVYYIIDELNNLCTYCHRGELRVKISS